MPKYPLKLQGHCQDVQRFGLNGRSSALIEIGQTCQNHKQDFFLLAETEKKKKMLACY